MDEDEVMGSSLHLKLDLLTTTLTTKEDVAKEIKEWMEYLEIDGVESVISYENAVKHIDIKLDRQLSCLETTWIERQYVITVLQLWLEKSLGKAFKYLDNEKNDIGKNMSPTLSQLDCINSLQDIRSRLNDIESPLRNWCDGECRFLKLILEQGDLFVNTHRFIVYVNCYFKQFKTSCIDKIFSRCLNDVVQDETRGATHEIFIAALNDFLSHVNEEKNSQDILEKEEFLENYIVDESKTGSELVDKLVEMFSCIKQEHERIAALPEWLQTFLSNASELSEDNWTPKLQVLIKETCKKFLLPETEIKFKEEDGKQIVSIRGVAIFVSKTTGEMSRLKREHPDVEEIKIIGLNSVHIDCDLDNDTWHGINIGIVTDKLIVDDGSTDKSGEVCWNVSGKNAKDQPRGESPQPGESGGNVHVVCNKIKNGQKWTIVSGGGDGSAGYKWTKEEFEKSFPSMSTGDGKEAMETVLSTLQKILPKENRTKGEDILPGYKGNFLIEGLADDGSEITAIFYGGTKKKQALISSTGSRVGQGGYGGYITIECFDSSQMNIREKSSIRSGIPFIGTDARRKPLTAIRLGVYESSCPNGNIGKVTGDVAFIHKFATNGSSNSKGTFYGFDDDIEIKTIIDKFEISASGNEMLSVKYEGNRYAELTLPNSTRETRNLQVKLIHAVKKKAVIRQSLLGHHDEIEQQTQSKKSMKKMLSNPRNHHTNSIGEILNEMESKVHQLHQLMIQRQQHQFQEIDHEQQYAKPATDLSSLSLPKPKIIGRRPVYIKELTKEMKRKPVIYCLDVLPTKDGVDSALHCLFGKMDSEGKYVCKDTTKFRKLIAKHIREKDLKNQIHNGVVMFVLRIKVGQKHPVANEKKKELIDSFIEKHQQVKGMETQVLRWLNHNDDYDDGEFLHPIEVEKWNETWLNCDEDSKSIKKQLLKEQDEWKKDEVLKEEYANTSNRQQVHWD